MEFGYFGEVGSEFASVAGGNLQFARRGQRSVGHSVEIAREGSFEFGVGESQRVEVEEDGTVGGVKVADAGDGLGFEEVQELADLMVSFERDVVAEVNEQRSVAGGLEAGERHGRGASFVEQPNGLSIRNL